MYIKHIINIYYIYIYIHIYNIYKYIYIYIYVYIYIFTFIYKVYVIVPCLKLNKWMEFYSVIGLTSSKLRNN